MRLDQYCGESIIFQEHWQFCGSPFNGKRTEYLCILDMASHQSTPDTALCHVLHKLSCLSINQVSQVKLYVVMTWKTSHHIMFIFSFLLRDVVKVLWLRQFLVILYGSWKYVKKDWSKHRGGSSFGCQFCSASLMWRPNLVL